jgi:uncharacterized membrane protein
MAGVRFWEIDALRGTAVVMMVVFHTVFALDFFGAITVSLAQGPWRLLALSTATLFITIAGVSISVSSARAAAFLDRRGVAAKNLKRGAGLFLAGMGITLVTWLLLPGEYILFGVLHCIGLSIALSPLFLGLGRVNFLAGGLVILLAPLVGRLEGPLALAWLGLHPAGFASLDYVPLIPWLGVFLLGMGIGASFYPGGLRGFPAREEPAAAGPVTLLGRHSLVIYLVHVPVILLALSLFVPGFRAALASLLFP